MKTVTVKLVDGKEFILKNTMRTIMIFEEISGKGIIDISTTKDYLQWLYSTLVGCNRDTFTYSWDEFIDLIDENPQLPISFNEFDSTPDILEPAVEEKPKGKKKQVNR
jgi:hypothetical protein